MTGTIKGFEVTTNRNSEQKVLMLQVEISGPDDIQSVEWYNPGGVQSVPMKGSKIQILQNGAGWKVAVSANDGIDFDESLNEGEKLIYSGNQDSTIKMLADGTIEVNGKNDNAVRYLELKTAFDELKTDHNDLVTLVNGFLTHVHPGIGAPPSPPAIPETPSTADMSDSKVETVLLPDLGEE